MKVALYARVATQRQGDKRATLQIEALRAHASKHGVVRRWIALA
jgi:DNA invertase Pin-like site-specific DNA recombinase